MAAALRQTRTTGSVSSLSFLTATEIASSTAARRTFVLNLITHAQMAIQLRLLGTVTDAVRSLTYTPSGRPRFTFGVRVGTIRTRKYCVTAYGSQARFADLYLQTGQRIRIEGAFLRRVPCYEGAVRADTIRHVGGATPLMNGTLVRFIPRLPVPEAGAPRPIPHAKSERRAAAPISDIDAAIAAAVS